MRRARRAGARRPRRLRRRARRAGGRSRERPPARPRRAAPGPPAPRRRARARNARPTSRPTTWPSTVTAPSAPMPPRIGPACWCKDREQRAGAPVDEALHQRLVQRVGEPVLELAGAALPGRRVGEPVGAVGDIGERAHAGEAHRQRVDVAVGAVEGARTGPASSPRACAGRPGSGARTGRRSAACARPASSCGSPASGRPPTGASRLARSRRGERPSRRSASWRSVVSSWASSESRRPAIGGGAASERMRPGKRLKVEPARCAIRPPSTGGKTWPSTAATTSASMSGASPVTPKVPSLRKRPARPAIWPISWA